MKQNLLLFKNLTLAVLLAAHSVALATTSTQPPQAKPAQAVVSKKELKENETLWDKAVDELRSAKISYKINIPSIELYRGIEIGGGYKGLSDVSVANNYAGIDIWEVGAGIDSRIFNQDLPISANTEASKKITYIQQFKTRKESLLRVPYDPITKIPREANDFFVLENGNYKFKVTDFIGYRIPLVFAVDLGTLQKLVPSLHGRVGHRYFLGGEFDIQIFRISETHIRLKIMAINDKVNSWYGTLKVFDFDPLTSAIVEKLLDDRIGSATWASRVTDLYLGDYILNLNSKDARNLYDSIVAQKMKIFNADLVRQYFGDTDILHRRSQFNENLFADLQQFNQVAAQDKDLPNDKKRIIKIVNAENHAEADESPKMINIFRAFRWSSNKHDTDAHISIINDDLQTTRNNYVLYSAGASSKMDFFSNWEREKRSQLNILFRADGNGRKQDIIGVHLSKSRYHHNFPRKKYLSFYEMTLQHMPDVIQNKITFPATVDSSDEKYRNTYLNFDLYATNEMFVLNQNLPRDLVAYRIDNTLKAIQSLKGDIDKKERNELIVKITEIFSTHTTYDKKYEIFDKLIKKNSLFSEFGSVLLINTLNPSSLNDCVLIQFSYSSHELGSLVQKYPSDEDFNRINLFKNIVDQNNYILDRSYNLRNYLKEDGSPFTLEELILKNDLNRKR